MHFTDEETEAYRSKECAQGMSLKHQMFNETEAGETRCKKFEQLSPNIACRVQRSSNSKGERFKLGGSSLVNVFNPGW